MADEEKNENVGETEEEALWSEGISEVDKRKMRETAAEGFEIDVYNPETGEWVYGQ